jgi:serine/threonine protein kinase
MTGGVRSGRALGSFARPPLAAAPEFLTPMQSRLFLGRYEATRLLGEGGMGRVYLARQTDLGRQVVVKVMHEHIAADAKFRDRFQRETLVMARFHHPCCVTLFDASLNDPNGPCIVMEYVKGVNLETLLRKNGKFTAARVGRIVGQLCEVLQAAHDEGIIHRDLKPANLMVVDPDTPRERIKVMDFGLAKLADEGPSVAVTDTAVDFAVGTPGYIAPEQIRGEAMDHRGDLYSVGAMMYELMTGRLPFVGATSMDVLLAHATEAPPTFADLGLLDWVPAPVEAVVRACLAKDPADRPQSARELGERFAVALGVRKVRGGGDAEGSASSVLSMARPRPTPGAGFPPAPAGDDSDVVPLSATGMTVATRSGPAVLTAPSSAVATGPTLRSTPAAQTTPLPNPAKDPTAFPFTMDAWMPESIALMKLRGFIQDYGGELRETAPGLVRLRLGRAPTSSGAFAWLGVSRRNGPVDVDMHFTRKDPKKENQLVIVVLFRPPVPALLQDKGWRDRCTQLFIDLRGYLMGGAG